MRRVISKVHVYNVVFEVSKAVYGVRNADFRLRKADFGVRKQVLESERASSTSRRIFLPALRAGEFFSHEITAGFFFCKVFLHPPPIKIKWSLP